jgi:nicotinate-nucleotide adenylyltransferase
MAEKAGSNVGILGGSFSPPHMGHVLAAHYALMRWSLSKVLVIPSFAHPFSKPLPPFEHRLAMCRLAFKHLGSYAEICDIEQELGGVSYTIETVRELVRRNPDERYHLVVGGISWRMFPSGANLTNSRASHPCWSCPA